MHNRTTYFLVTDTIVGHLHIDSFYFERSMHVAVTFCDLRNELIYASASDDSGDGADLAKLALQAGLFADVAIANLYAFTETVYDAVFAANDLHMPRPATHINLLAQHYDASGATGTSAPPHNVNPSRHRPYPYGLAACPNCGSTSTPCDPSAGCLPANVNPALAASDPDLADCERLLTGN